MSEVVFRFLHTGSPYLEFMGDLMKKNADSSGNPISALIIKGTLRDVSVFFKYRHMAGRNPIL